MPKFGHTYFFPSPRSPWKAAVANINPDPKIVAKPVHMKMGGKETLYKKIKQNQKYVQNKNWQKNTNKNIKVAAGV